MATKPTDLARWADAGGASLVEPSDGKKDVGWLAGERPAAQYKNWWQHTVHTWIKYLSDGVFTGAVQFVNGVTNGLSIVTGNLTIVAGGIQMLGDLDLEGDIIHGERTKLVSLYSGAGNGTLSQGRIQKPSADALSHEVGLDFILGDQIVGCAARVNDASGNAVTMSLYEKSEAGVETLIADATSSGTGDDAVLTINDGVLIDSADFRYYVRFTTANDTGGTLPKVYRLAVTYDHPGLP